jgi:signal peptidase I
MKSFQERIKNVTIKGWISCAVSSIAYIAFIVWVAWGDWKSLAWIVLLPVIIDAFTTKYINWGWWKKYKPITKEEKAKGIKRPQANKVLYTIFSWIDAILFALVAVYFINIYFFQNYQIPTSSLEKTLRVGDFLCVNKMCYGARVPNTPLSMPLVQHTMPWGSKSYIDKPQWEYKRLKGWDKVEKGDIVVMLSDGIVQSFDETPWLCEILTFDTKDDTCTLAEKILAKAKYVNARRDDMSVVVLKIV